MAVEQSAGFGGSRCLGLLLPLQAEAAGAWTRSQRPTSLPPLHTLHSPCLCYIKASCSGKQGTPLQSPNTNTAHKISRPPSQRHPHPAQATSPLLGSRPLPLPAPLASTSPPSSHQRADRRHGSPRRCHDAVLPRSRLLPPCLPCCRRRCAAAAAAAWRIPSPPRDLPVARLPHAGVRRQRARLSVWARAPRPRSATRRAPQGGRRRPQALPTARPGVWVCACSRRPSCSPLGQCAGCFARRLHAAARAPVCLCVPVRAWSACAAAGWEVAARAHEERGHVLCTRARTQTCKAALATLLHGPPRHPIPIPWRPCCRATWCRAGR